MKEKFKDLCQDTRETLLMETAMRIMEVFCDMQYACHVNPYKVDRVGSIERLYMFSQWAKEFEEKYYGTEEYEDDFLYLSDKYAQERINEEFGIEEV